jgi:hypothetical protein
VTEENQAQYLTQAYHCASGDPYVALMGWFTARDASSRETGGFDELQHYGLLHEGGNGRKPSWSAFNQIATAGDPLSSPCGDFAGPSIKILTPKVGESYSGHLLIQAQAHDPGGIGRVSFYADGKLIRNFTVGNDETASIDWAGAQDLSIGPHQIGVAALDKEGNQEVASVDVRKVSTNSLLAVGPATFGGAFAKAVAKGGGGARCRGRVCTVKGSIKSPAGAKLPGKVEVRWQLGRKAGGKLRYKTLHKKRRNASRPFTFTQRLRKGGQWRVGIVYLPPKPLKRAASPYGYFRVK